MSGIGQASSTAIQSPFVDLKTGLVTSTWQYVLQQWQRQLAGGFDPSGNLKSDLLPTVRIVGRLGSIGAILGHISATGVIDSSGMTSATDTAQGAVQLATGSTGHVLGSAAMQPVAAFDAAGSASAAQTAAEAHADAVAATAQSNAITTAGLYTDSRITAAFAPGISGSVTLAKITGGGTDGSLTFAGGLITARVDPT